MLDVSFRLHLVALTVCYTAHLSFSVSKDYPSIAHLVQKLSDNNIQTIFAVTEEFQPVYQVSSLSVCGLFFFFLSDISLIPFFWTTVFLIPFECMCAVGR